MQLLIQQAQLLGIKPISIGDYGDYIYLKREDSVFSVSTKRWYPYEGLPAHYESSTWGDWIEQRKPHRYQTILRSAIESCK